MGEEGILWAKNTLLRERNPALGQMGASLGIQIAIQKMKISSTTNTCDKSDMHLLISRLYFKLRLRIATKY